jgi:genetic interactor of prohibitins 3, mitochondrial
MNVELQVAYKFITSKLRLVKLRAPSIQRNQRLPRAQLPFSTLQRRSHPATSDSLRAHHESLGREPPQIRPIPISCPGCGALSQQLYKDEAGFYNIDRRSVQAYLYGDEIFQPANPYPVRQGSIGDEIDTAKLANNATQESHEIPYCDRCHNLLHHNQGLSIANPTLADINATLKASPHHKNHVYHVLDAADFPMSLIPTLHETLALGHIRSRNRRARQTYYSHGLETDMSFIITRADLLAPKKQQVDNLLPKLVEILRDAMGTFGQRARLHVRCVSSYRGWWTKTVKEEIWERGGGQWLVGKVNVGKSGLLQTVFPKGRCDSADFRKLETASGNETLASDELRVFKHHPRSTDADMPEKFPSFSLLPPPQPLVKYPTMPIISSLPGTTASPIRIPFGNKKGELIDLPGLNRVDLSPYVFPEHRQKLIMESRLKPERIIIKPGSSLLLGGLIRITPTTEDQIIMAHVFAPLPIHLTKTEKATELQTGSIQVPTIPNYATPEAQNSMALAGTFTLKTDVTKEYAGPLTRKDAVGLKLDRLPFVVYGTDILIAGCGWVELLAQVRRPKGEDGELSQLIASAKMSGGSKHMLVPKQPQVEIWSPEGKCIRARICIGAWALGGRGPRIKK